MCFKIEDQLKHSIQIVKENKKIPAFVTFYQYCFHFFSRLLIFYVWPLQTHVSINRGLVPTRVGKVFVSALSTCVVKLFSLA